MCYSWSPSKCHRALDDKHSMSYDEEAELVNQRCRRDSRLGREIECIHDNECYENDGHDEALCGVRVSQMTKTYNDVEAVTRLLEEKERDLEIAARIGQSLLEKNRDIQEKNATLEDDVRYALEQVNQLRHEVQMKDDLLQIYTHDLEGGDSPGDHHGLLSLFHLENLQSKVKDLEEDNLQLRAESAELKTETCDYEEKEAQLVKDCVRQLSEANAHVKVLAEDLGKKTDSYLSQQEEITNLLAKVCNLEAKIKKLTIENAEMQSHLQAAQHSQHQLTSEILDLQDKCNEYVELLSSANEEIKTLRTKNRPKAMRYQYGGSPFLPSDSLASELEDTFKKDLDFPAGYSPRERKHHNYKVMETARIARINQRRPKLGLNIPGSNMSTSGNESDISMRSQRNSLYLSDSESMISEGTGYQGDTDSVCGNRTPICNVNIPTRTGMTSSCLSVTAAQTVMSSTVISSMASSGGNANITTTTMNSGNTSFGTTTSNQRTSSPNAGTNANIGKPGIPGSNDLETALRRLSLRHAHDVFERKYRESEDLMSANSSRFGSETGSLTPTPCYTPESLMSTGSCLSGMSGPPSGGGYTFKMPEKLQIVKPMEGSMTLHQWQRLATPHLGGFLEDRPGVQIKGERKVDFGNDFENYSITDFEEDDPDEEEFKYMNVRKCAESTSSTYTYTTAKIMHPTDDYALTTLSSSTGTSSTPRPTCSLLSPMTESSMSRSATSTFSMNLGLSQTLKERGFHTETVQLSNPTRVSSIVTETLYDKQRAQPTTIYTTAMTEPTIRVTESYSHGLPEPPYFGITEKPDWSKLESFANTLSDKIRNIGVDRLFGSSTEDETEATDNEKEATESEKESAESVIETSSDKDTKKERMSARPKLTIKIASGDMKCASPTATPPNSPICATPPSPITPPNSPIGGTEPNSKSAFSFNFVSPILQIAGLQLRRKSDFGLLGAMQIPNREAQPPGLFRGLSAEKKS
ncbi:trafficking kinesin-binding protein 1-like isoform X3 [Lineus longissimus]|uniref:trafficking kinesin-binding protein 1-like isoform X3 n=1 Tax=Lineus longissimus TaxID=88925 RepID=UPI00315D3582